MTDQTDINSNTTNESPTPSYYMVHHNDTIIGFYDTNSDAIDALNAYQMSNTIDLNDVLEILSII